MLVDLAQIFQSAVIAAEADTANQLIGTSINIGAFALVGWLVRHTFSHTIPRLASEFSQALKEQRQEFIEALELLRQDMREDRNRCFDKIDELHRTFKEDLQTIQQTKHK